MSLASPLQERSKVLKGRRLVKRAEPLHYNSDAVYKMRKAPPGARRQKSGKLICIGRAGVIDLHDAEIKGFQGVP